MTEPGWYETYPEPVTAMQFDGTIEGAQAILEWAESNDIRGVLHGSTVALELLVNNTPVPLVEGVWIIRNQAGQLTFESDETFPDKYREQTDG